MSMRTRENEVTSMPLNIFLGQIVCMYQYIFYDELLSTGSNTPFQDAKTENHCSLPLLFSHYVKSTSLWTHELQPGFLVLHCLLEFAQMHGHWVGDAIHAIFTVQLAHPYMTTGKIIGLTIWIFVGKVMSLLFNTLSSFFISFLSKGQAFFNFMAAVTICSDFGAQEN